MTITALHIMEHLQPDVLQLVFDMLPAIDALVTVTCVCRTWSNAAQQHMQQHPQVPSAAPLLPLRYFKELWNQVDMPTRMRDMLANAASIHGQVAALQHALDSQWHLKGLPDYRLLAEHGHLQRCIGRTEMAT